MSALPTCRAPFGAGARNLVLALLLTLPWLNPYAGGPSASVIPWLFSAICACGFALVAGRGFSGTTMAFASIALAAWAFVRTGATSDTWALAGVLLLMVLVASAARPASDGVETAIARAWIAAGVLSTAIAVVQYFGWAHHLGGLASVSEQGEAYANLRQRNQFATLTVISLAAVIWRAAARPWAWAAATWLAAGTAATTSRTGLLEFLGIAILAVCWGDQERTLRVRLAASAAVAYLAAAIALPMARAHLLGLDASNMWDRVSGVASCSSRTVLWGNVLYLIRERPWSGWGWGELDFAHYATLYPGERFCDILDNAHNLLLHVAVELGIPAAMLLALAIAAFVLRGRPWKESMASRRMAWSVLAVLGVHSMLEYPLWYGPFQISAALCLGLLCPPVRHASVSWRAGTQVVCILFAVAIAYATWDYRRVSQIYLPPEERVPIYRQATLDHVRRSWLFRAQAAFAELTITPLTAERAAWAWERSQKMLHYSPEPKVIEIAIESALLLDREQDAAWHLARYRRAFPEACAKWLNLRSNSANH